MKRLLKCLTVVFFFFLFLSPKISFAGSPLQISLYNPIQMINEEQDILGLRVNLLYGVNENITGIDLGPVNRSNGYQRGIMWGIFNSTYDFSGIQVGLINKTEWLNGFQLGLINISNLEKRKWVPFCNFSF
jgi:hypothetical protein